MTTETFNSYDILSFLVGNMTSDCYTSDPTTWVRAMSQLRVNHEQEHPDLFRESLTDVPEYLMQVECFIRVLRGINDKPRPCESELSIRSKHIIESYAPGSMLLTGDTQRNMLLMHRGRIQPPYQKVLIEMTKEFESYLRV